MLLSFGEIDSHTVATREGGVDRNTRFIPQSSPFPVATREGGVDRNICKALENSSKKNVATREGGVDRNMTST